MIMVILVTQIVFAPMHNPCLLQIAWFEMKELTWWLYYKTKLYTPYGGIVNSPTCGDISPITTMAKVEHIMATSPDVKSSNKIVNIEFTSTFENNIEHNK